MISNCGNMCFGDTVVRMLGTCDQEVVDSTLGRDSG